MATVYAIYEENMERLEKKLTRIAGRCKKNNLPFSYQQVGEEYREYNDGDVVLRFVLVEVEGNSKINGWNFIASLAHKEDGNLVNRISGDEVPQQYRTAAPICEHCNTLRNRSETFLVQNEETGEYKQVGRSCLADFLGGLDAESYAQYLSIFEELLLAEEVNPQSAIQHYSVEEIVTAAAYLTRTLGYVKSKEENSTVSKIKDTMRDKLATNKDREAAREAIQWAADGCGKENGERSEYEHNLNTLCGGEYTNYKTWGYLASLPTTYQRYKVRKAQEDERKQQAGISQWQGNGGEKITITNAEMTYVTTMYSQWGGTNLYRFASGGNTYIWYTSKDLGDNRTVTLTGTIKDHSEFQDEKQTILTRCKITEN